MAAISVEGLVRGYGSIQVLQGLDMTVEEGSIYGLLGPSGCGKTTLLKTILGFLAPESGTLSVKVRYRVLMLVIHHKKSPFIQTSALQKQ